MPEPLFLNIGSGARKLPGFVNIDVEPGADIQLDAGVAELPFENGSVQGVVSEHFIEHLSQAEGISFLRECRRVVAPDGVVRVATPDLDTLVAHFQNDWRAAVPDAKYGYQWIANRAELINIGFRHWGHQWLYNEEELVRLGTFAGLEFKRRWQVGESDVDALHGLEHRDASLVVEFVKAPRVVEPAPLVSILIPAYNPRFFAEALESALAQTYAHTEIVVSDDCPIDAVREIVHQVAKANGIAVGDKDAAGARLRYTRNVPSLGPRENVLHLFRLARGVYIKYLNDDDLLRPTCVERMVACFRDHPDVTLVTSHRESIDAAGSRLPDTLATVPLLSGDAVLGGQALADLVLRLGVNVIGEPTTAMFPRERLAHFQPDMLTLGGVAMPSNGDVTLWLNLLSQGDAIYLVESLSAFRRHPEQEQAQPDATQRGIRAWAMLREHGTRMGFLVRGTARALRPRPLNPARDPVVHVFDFAGAGAGAMGRQTFRVMVPGAPAGGIPPQAAAVARAVPGVAGAPGAPTAPPVRPPTPGRFLLKGASPEDGTLRGAALSVLALTVRSPLDVEPGGDEAAVLARATRELETGGDAGFQRAYDVLSAALKDGAEMPALRAAAADLLLAAEQPGEAMAVLLDAMTDPPRQPGIYVRAGLAALLAGQVEDAQSAFGIVTSIASEALAAQPLLTNQLVKLLSMPEAQRAAR